MVTLSRQCCRVPSSNNYNTFSIVFYILYLHIDMMSPEKSLYSGGTSSPIQTHWRGPTPPQNPTMYTITADNRIGQISSNV